MYFEKQVKIQDKIFRKKDIYALWEFIEKQKKSSRSGTASIVVTNDDETVHSEDKTIFSTVNFCRKNIKRSYGAGNGEYRVSL